MIRETVMIIGEESEEFYEKLNDEMRILQEQGFEVEIHYGATQSKYTALLVARDEFKTGTSLEPMLRKMCIKK